MGKEMLASATEKIHIGAEDDLRAFTMEDEENFDLSLMDGRDRANHAEYTMFVWLVLRSPHKRFAVKITPRTDPNRRHKPVIQVSQLGYHPMQRKQAVLKPDPRTTRVKNVTHSRLTEDMK